MCCCSLLCCCCRCCCTHQVFLWSSGIIFSSPFLTASVARFAIPLQSNHHCGFNIGSIMSPVREHLPNLILLIASPRERPFSLSAFNTSPRASSRIMPANWPVFSAIAPSSVKIVISSNLCRRPHRKSLGSCAGVTLTAPVPKDISTRTCCGGAVGEGGEGGV